MRCDGGERKVTLGNRNDGLRRAIADARSARRRWRRVVDVFNEVPVERGTHYVACNAQCHHSQTKPNHNATAIHSHLSLFQTMLRGCGVQREKEREIEVWNQVEVVNSKQLRSCFFTPVCFLLLHLLQRRFLLTCCLSH